MEFESNAALLDLFQPHQLTETLKYQATALASDCWERQHINAMVYMCEYVASTYPTLYPQIERIHTHFKDKEEDL